MEQKSNVGRFSLHPLCPVFTFWRHRNLVVLVIGRPWLLKLIWTLFYKTLHTARYKYPVFWCYRIRNGRPFRIRYFNSQHSVIVVEYFGCCKQQPFVQCFKKKKRRVLPKANYPERNTEKIASACCTRMASSIVRNRWKADVILPHQSHRTEAEPTTERPCIESASTQSATWRKFPFCHPIYSYSFRRWKYLWTSTKFQFAGFTWRGWIVRMMNHPDGGE